MLAGAWSLCGPLTAFAVAARSREKDASVGLTLRCAVLHGWWSRVEPSNERDWQLDVAGLAHAEAGGDLVTVRNLACSSETDYTPHCCDRAYDLAKLQSVGLVAVYWLGPASAHTILSFGFEGGDHLALSIGIRQSERSIRSWRKCA